MNDETATQYLIRAADTLAAGKGPEGIPGDFVGPLEALFRFYADVVRWAVRPGDVARANGLMDLADAVLGEDST